jgi:hypothetical protein
MKGVAEKGINTTPYVEIEWGHDGTKDRGLFDSGSQWTLISNKLLRKEEMLNLENSSLVGQSVAGDRLPVMGEIWRSVKIGGLTFTNQRFVVVERMICPIILGIDFWSRVSSISFDFNRKTMRLNGESNEEIRLWPHPYSEQVVASTTMGDAGPLKVEVKFGTSIPANTEKLVKCYVNGMQSGRDYMISPIGNDDVLVSTPYGLIEGNTSGVVEIKVVNLNSGEINLEKGACVAMLDSEIWVTDSKAGRAFKDNSPKSNIDWDMMCDKKTGS